MARSKWILIKKLLPEIKRKLEIEKWTKKDLINWLPVSAETFYKYLKKYPELSDIVESGINKTLIEVETSFIKSALGYYVEEEQTEVFYTVDLKGEMVPSGMKTVKKKRFINASVAAQLHILKRLGGWREDDYANQSDDELLDLTDHARKSMLKELDNDEEVDDDF